MAMYLGSEKVAVTNTVEKQIPSMKAYFDKGGHFNGHFDNLDGCFKYDDTSDVTDMSTFFSNCSYLKNAPSINTSKATTMHSMFYYDSDLKNVPQYDTSNVTNTQWMFYNCYSLKIIPSYDMLKVTNANNMFTGCGNLEFIHIININANLNISESPKFTREALLEILGNLVPQTSGSKKLTMGSKNLAKLTDADKKIATDKGWTLA